MVLFLNGERMNSKITLTGESLARNDLRVTTGFGIRKGCLALLKRTRDNRRGSGPF